MKATNTARIAGIIARILLGITFVFSGFVKAVDPLGTTYKIEDYLAAFSSTVNYQLSTINFALAEPAAWALICFEMVLGVMLLLNLWPKLNAWLALAMMLVMTPLTLYLALTNPISDCGCFGDALVLSNWQTFWKNVVLLALVVVLLLTRRTGHDNYQLSTINYQLIITCVALSLPLGLMAYSRTHLPFLDFRPYKIGNNIPELMEIPEGAPTDEYAITFIYEKDGEEREFTLADYPKDDPSWTFVDQRSTLIKKGYEAPIHDFTIVNEDFDDLTYDVLEDERPVTLAILYKVEKTDLEQAKRLNQMATEAEWRDEPFYLLTGSGEEEIEAFREAAGYEYPIYSCDPVTLKTIVRANPGIVLLQEGTIIDKYNLRNR